MKMLDQHPELTLEFLNTATQAWVEIEYNRAEHRELACAPVQRFTQAPDVLGVSPSSAVLRGCDLVSPWKCGEFCRWERFFRVEQ